MEEREMEEMERAGEREKDGEYEDRQRDQYVYFKTYLRGYYSGYNMRAKLACL